MAGVAPTKRRRQPDKPRTRAYVFLHSQGDNRNKAARILERQAGVVAVDLVEGPPDIVFVIEAPDRRRLASVLMKAMASIQTMTDGLELLPVEFGQPVIG